MTSIQASREAQNKQTLAFPSYYPQRPEPSRVTDGFAPGKTETSMHRTLMSTLTASPGIAPRLTRLPPIVCCHPGYANLARA